MSTNELPEGFQDIERFAAQWVLPTEAQRYEERLTSSMAELQTFYDAMLPRMEPAMSHLDRFTVGKYPEKEQRLLNLALMFMEVAPAVELFFDPDVPEGFPWRRFQIDRM